MTLSATIGFVAFIAITTIIVYIRSNREARRQIARREKRRLHDAHALKVWNALRNREGDVE